MNTLVHEVATASPYGDDPVGTRRPLTDFRSEIDPSKYLAGYQRRNQDPIRELLGMPYFDDARDDVIGDRQVTVVLVNAIDGEELSDETWVGFWDEDGNIVDEDTGELTADKMTVVRIA
jgi:hypothetical protein